MLTSIKALTFLALLWPGTMGSENNVYLGIYPNTSNSLAANRASIPLYFGLMLSLSGGQQSTGALAGVKAALDDINSRDDLLPGYSLHYTLTDTQVNTIQTCC